MSGIPIDLAALARALPGIGRDAGGAPQVSAELFTITEIRREEAGQRVDYAVALRGMEPMGLALRPEARVIEGRWFASGRRELVAGRAILRQFPEVRVGNTLRFRGADWAVVGAFESGGDAHESEIWTDAGVARDAFGAFAWSSLLVRLDAAGALDTLTAAAAADPRLQLDVRSERAFFMTQSQSFGRNVGAVSRVVSAFMAIGALFGALNTLYAAVSSRRREIATLRAIGFSGLPVVISVIAEAALLALIGGLIGAAVVYMAFNGMTVSTMGQSFTQIASTWR